MLQRFFPDLILDNFKEVSYEILEKKNIKAIILDIDNTLVTYDQLEPTEDVISWVRDLQKKDIKLSIVSNAKAPRVEKFNKKLNLFIVSKAAKPSTYGFLKALEQMKVEPYQTAVIGDQIFTDIYGGKRANMLTILVKPISNNEIFPIRIKRWVEKFVFYRYYKTNKKN
jgi:HAD superfamily phosphatase (TIGR01668 family)